MKKTSLLALGLIFSIALVGCSANGTDTSNDNTMATSEIESTLPGLQNQLSDYLSQLFFQAYQPYYDGLRYEMTDYGETIAADGGFTVTFVWTMFYQGNGLDAPSDLGEEQQINYVLQATGTVDRDGLLDAGSVQILADNSVAGEPNYAVPIEDFFPGTEK